MTKKNITTCLDCGTGWRRCNTTLDKGRGYTAPYCTECRDRRISPGTVVHTLVTSVASSGMSRTIRVLVAEDGDIRDISHFAARAIGWREAKQGGVIVAGGGMDMGFHLVSCLAYALYGNDLNQLKHRSL